MHTFKDGTKAKASSTVSGQTLAITHICIHKLEIRKKMSFCSLLNEVLTERIDDYSS